MDDYVWAALDYAESRRRREVSVRLVEWVPLKPPVVNPLWRNRAYLTGWYK
jgi:hypothetical protein